MAADESKLYQLVHTYSIARKVRIDLCSRVTKALSKECAVDGLTLASYIAHDRRENKKISFKYK